MGLLTVALVVMLVVLLQLMTMEKIDEMRDEIKAKLQAIRANQIATTSAVENLRGDITRQDAKIVALAEALANTTLDPETQTLLDETLAGSEALKAQAETTAAIVAEAPDPTPDPDPDTDGDDA